MALFTCEELRGICVRHNWFTGGTNEQYGKLFDRCRENANMQELALLIWVCTPDVERQEIENALNEEKEVRYLGQIGISSEAVLEMTDEEFRETVRIMRRLRRENKRKQREIEMEIEEDDNDIY